MNKKTILIVEDSPYLAESLVDMMNMEGHEAIVAANGRDGITKAIDRKPDLIILDIQLPDIDGYDVYHTIRENSWGKNAKILILTASESAKNIMKNVDLPSERILFKPEWSAPDLIKKINSVLED
jgi:DNA-binding response OmpR family regulator